MVRYFFINNLVLQIYSSLSVIKFPLDINDVISLIPNCKYMTYQKFAELNNCSFDDVVNLCESKSGCTHYNVATGKYLILCNSSTQDNNNIGRQRWTCCHEIGHILCKHHIINSEPDNPEFETEADYFAATLLAPFPLYKELNIKSASDIRKTFGLSTQASINRFEQYQSWLKSHRKTSWENDMLKIYRRNLYYRTLRDS